MESTEVKTLVAITGVAKFTTLIAPEVHPEYPDGGARYRMEFNTPKQNPELKPLLAAIQHVARRTWVGAQLNQRVLSIKRTIEEGIGDANGTIGLLNGDAYKPEYNKGTYVVRASARSDQRPAYRRWDDEAGKYVLCNEPPKPGDLVRVYVEVWAMAKHPRINLTIKSVQVQQGGEAFMPISGGQTVTEAMLDEELNDAAPEVLSLFEGMRSAGLAAIDAGEPTPEPKKIAPKVEGQLAKAKAATAPAAEAKPKGRSKKAAPAPEPTITYEPEIVDEGDGGEDLDLGLDDAPPAEDGDDLFAGL